MHFHYHVWPDHGVPNSTESIRRLSNLLWDSGKCEPLVVHCRSVLASLSSVVLVVRVLKLLLEFNIEDFEQSCPGYHRGFSFVHACSAGIGRTGAFIAIDIIMKRLRAMATLESPPSEDDIRNAIEVPEVVHSLRRMRRGMVQTMDQYEFIYRWVGACLNLLCSALLPSSLASSCEKHKPTHPCTRASLTMPRCCTSHAPFSRVSLIHTHTCACTRMAQHGVAWSDSLLLTLSRRCTCTTCNPSPLAEPCWRSWTSGWCLGPQQPTLLTPPQQTQQPATGAPQPATGAPQPAAWLSPTAQTPLLHAAAPTPAIPEGAAVSSTQPPAAAVVALPLGVRRRQAMATMALLSGAGDAPVVLAAANSLLRAV